MKIILTRELIEAGKSTKGAYSEKQVNCFGLTLYKLKSGWIDGLIGIEIDQEKYDKFLSLKDAHLKHKMVGPDEIKAINQEYLNITLLNKLFKEGRLKITIDGLESPFKIHGVFDVSNGNNEYYEIVLIK